MKTNTLIIVMFGGLFALIGLAYWWVVKKGSQFVSDTATQTINDAKNQFSLKDIVLAGGQIGAESLLDRLKTKRG